MSGRSYYSHGRGHGRRPSTGSADTGSRDSAAVRPPPQPPSRPRWTPAAQDELPYGPPDQGAFGSRDGRSAQQLARQVSPDSASARGPFSRGASFAYEAQNERDYDGPGSRRAGSPQQEGHVDPPPRFRTLESLRQTPPTLPAGSRYEENESGPDRQTASHAGATSRPRSNFQSSSYTPYSSAEKGKGRELPHDSGDLAPPPGSSAPPTAPRFPRADAARAYQDRRDSPGAVDKWRGNRASGPRPGARGADSGWNDRGKGETIRMGGGEAYRPKGRDSGRGSRADWDSGPPIRGRGGWGRRGGGWERPPPRPMRTIDRDADRESLTRRPRGRRPSISSSSSFSTSASSRSSSISPGRRARYRSRTRSPSPKRRARSRSRERERTRNGASAAALSPRQKRRRSSSEESAQSERYRERSQRRERERDKARARDKTELDVRHERQKESEYSKARAGEQARERDSPRARDKNRTQGNWKYDKNKVVDKDKDRGWTRDRDRDRFRGGVGNRERSMDRGEEKDWGRDRDAFIDTNGSRRYERERHREGSIRSSTSAKNGKAGKPDRSRSRSPLRSPSPRSPPQRTRPVAGNRGRDTAREEQPEPEARHEPVFAETVEEPSAPAVGQGRILARKAPLEGTNPFTSAASPPLLATAAPRPSAPKALQLSDDTKSSIPLASNTLTNGQTAIESPPKRSGWKVVRSASPSVVRASNASSQPPASSSASTRATYSEHSPTGQLATQLQPTSASMDVDSDVDGAPMDADSSGDPMPMPTPGTLHTSGNRSPGPVQGTSASQLDTMSCATMQGSGQAPHSRAIQGMPPPPARFTSDLQTANQENAVHLKTKEGIGRAPSTFSLQKSQPRAQASEPTAAPRPTRSPAPSAAMLAAMAAAADTDPSSAPLAPGNLNRELPPAPVAEISPPRAMPGEAYERIVQVGEGTYGQVFKARAEQSGVLVALKKIRMEAEKDGFPVTAMREIKLLQALRHRNVVRLHEMMVSRGSVYMVFEYMEHDLNGVLSHPSITFTPAHLKSLSQQLLEGLSYLHRKSVLHRDLKGSNILLNNAGLLKLADFGLARFYQKRRQGDYTNRVVTLWYRPPELLFGATKYGPEVDMWGAGCIFLELFTRRPVFQGNDEIHQLHVLTEVLGPATPDQWPGVQDLPWYDLVRPTAEEGTALSQHAVASEQQFRETFGEYLSPAALAVAHALLLYDPKKRASASQALQMDYFTREQPRAVMPAGLLAAVEGDWHEYESKRARKRGTKSAAGTHAEQEHA